MDELDFDVKKFRSDIQSFLKKFIFALSAYSGLPSLSADKDFKFTVDSYSIKNKYITRGSSPYYWQNLLAIKYKREKIFTCIWGTEYTSGFGYQVKIKKILKFNNENYVFLRNLLDLMKAKIDILEME
jgi:hypothetical protein